MELRLWSKRRSQDSLPWNGRGQYPGPLFNMARDLNNRREWIRRTIRERRTAWIVENGPCKHCGSLVDLEIDHIDPKQKQHSISGMWLHPTALYKELLKCQVLCRVCHSAKTDEDFPIRKGVHGTRNRWMCGCRCEPCKKAMAMCTTRWRNNKRQRLLNAN